MRKYIEACKCGGKVFLCRDYTRFGLPSYKCVCNRCKVSGSYACESLDAYISFKESYKKHEYEISRKKAEEL